MPKAAHYTCDEHALFTRQLDLFRRLLYSDKKKTANVCAPLILGHILARARNRLRRSSTGYGISGSLFAEKLHRTLEHAFGLPNLLDWKQPLAVHRYDQVGADLYVSKRSPSVSASTFACQEQCVFSSTVLPYSTVHTCRWIAL